MALKRKQRDEEPFPRHPTKLAKPETKYVRVQAHEKEVRVPTKCFERKLVEIDIQHQIGSGAFGTVYSACLYPKGQHTGESKCIARIVKVLMNSSGRYGGKDDFQATFENECRAGTEAGTLGLGPMVDDCWTCSSRKKRRMAFILMEYLQGSTLAGVYSRLAVEETNRLVSPLVEKLHQFHQKYNWAHNDIHGGNILLDAEKTRAWVIDYGQTTPILEGERDKTLGQWALTKPTAQLLIDRKFIRSDVKMSWSELADFEDLLDAFGVKEEEKEGTLASKSSTAPRLVSVDSRNELAQKTCLSCLQRNRTALFVLQADELPWAIVRGIVYQPTNDSDSSAEQAHVFRVFVRDQHRLDMHLKQMLVKRIRRLTNRLGWNATRVKLDWVDEKEFA